MVDGMSKKPSPAQAEQAVDLLREFVDSDEDNSTTYARAVQLLAEIDRPRKRVHTRRSPRWIRGMGGVYFRTGDTVITPDGDRLKVGIIDAIQKTAVLSDGSLYIGSTLVKHASASRATTRRDMVPDRTTPKASTQMTIDGMAEEHGAPPC